MARDITGLVVLRCRNCGSNWLTPQLPMYPDSACGACIYRGMMATATPKDERWEMGYRRLVQWNEEQQTYRSLVHLWGVRQLDQMAARTVITSKGLDLSYCDTSDRPLLK